MKNSSIQAGERTQITKIIAMTLNGFHGYQTSNVRATFLKLPEMDNEERHDLGYRADAAWEVEITESAARKFACTASDCRCGEGVPITFTCDQYDFDSGTITLRGSYPQR